MSGEISKKGFTLLELLAVVIIIGILATLAYSGFMEIIQANKAKEAARTMTTFVERAIAEGKMRKEAVTITIGTNKIEATTGTSEPLPSGFSNNIQGISPLPCTKANEKIEAKMSIGTSGVSGTPCLVACNARGYCGAAVKETDKNNFSAQIKKGSDNWRNL